MHHHTDHRRKRGAAAAVVAAIAVVLVAALAAGPAAASAHRGVSQYIVTVTLSGTGSGSVTSDPSGIDCPSTCQAGYPQDDSTVTLTAAPDAGSTFVQWTGDCDFIGSETIPTCGMEMDNPKNVTAEFALAGPSAPSMLKPNAPYQRQKAKFDVSWTTVSGDGVKYDVQMRHAPYTTATFGGFSTIHTDLTSTLFHFTGTPGSSYCFRARARDASGSSAYSAPACTAVPLDDRAMTQHGDWTENHLFGYFLNTFLRTKSHGASVTKAAVHGDEIAVEATVCPACGSIRVSWAGHTHAFSLVGPDTKREQLFVLSPGPSSGLVTVTVTSTDKKVEIDGLGVGIPLPV